MSNRYKLPKILFRLQLHTAIAKFKKNQAPRPGSSFLLTVFLCLSLLSLGSCNEKVSVEALMQNPLQIDTLSPNRGIEHIYNLQIALAQNPARIEYFSDRTLEWVMAKPDSVRQEGSTEVWQYIGAQCVLDVYWNKKSAHILEQYDYIIHQRLSLFDDVSRNKNTNLSDWACMQSLIQERRQDVEKNFDERHAVLLRNEQRS